MNELELLVDLYKGTERQGPGSAKETLRALDLMNISGNEKLNIADIGCGTGSQTMTLAQHADGQITALDLMPVFLEELNLKSQELGIQDRIKTVEKSMEELPFDKESLDIIWSEGAIYNIGFENGVKQWKDYLKPNGFLSVSEITWLTNERPNELEDYWNTHYPEIDTASNKIRILEKYGFSPIGYFTLSQKSWIDNYYVPLEKCFPEFLNRHGNFEMATNVVEETKAEISMYMKFKKYFSYGFYIAKKVK